MPKPLLSPELMHNNVWPFPSKPHPVSLGSGQWVTMVTGLTHPLHFFFLFQGKRLKSKGEKKKKKNGVLLPEYACIT